MNLRTNGDLNTTVVSIMPPQSVCTNWEAFCLVICLPSKLFYKNAKWTSQTLIIHLSPKLSQETRCITLEFATAISAVMAYHAISCSSDGPIIGYQLTNEKDSKPSTRKILMIFLISPKNSKWMAEKNASRSHEKIFDMMRSKRHLVKTLTNASSWAKGKN